MSIIREQFEELANKGIYVDTYRDGISEESIFGRIIAYGNELILIKTFKENGLYDGYSIVFIEDISRLRWGGTERYCFTRLVEQKGQDSSDVLIELGSMENILEQVSEKYGYVTIHTEELNSELIYVGEIMELDEDYLKIKEYGSMNSLDRAYLILKMGDITRIDFDGPYEKDLISLYKVK